MVEGTKSAPVRIVTGVAISAFLLSVVALFVPFFSVLRERFNVWKIHQACSMASYARTHALKEIIIIPPVLGSADPCSAVAIAWTALIVIGLLGASVGIAVVVWHYGKAQA